MDGRNGTSSNKEWNIVNAFILKAFGVAGIREMCLFFTIVTQLEKAIAPAIGLFSLLFSL